ncbi:MAG: porin family protein [Bacteroidales bacterium]|nr:porin family protein [Bacteroidales bacterium]
MKQRLLLLGWIFVTLISYYSLDAQVIKGGIIFGGNLSQVDGDRAYGFKQFGFNVGATAIVPFTEKWSLSIETLFSQEGAHQKETNVTNDYPLPINGLDDTSIFYSNITNYYNLRLNYVKIPVLVHYNDRRFSVGAGFQYGRLVSVKENNRIASADPNVPLPPYYDLDKFSNKNDLNIIADIKFRIWSGLYINARYSYSLIPIRTVNMVFVKSQTNELWAEELKQFNNTISLRLIWVFNDNAGTLKKQGTSSKGI